MLKPLQSVNCTDPLLIVETGRTAGVGGSQCRSEENFSSYPLRGPLLMPDQ